MSTHASLLLLPAPAPSSWRAQLSRNLASVRLLACPASPRSAAARCAARARARACRPPFASRALRARPVPPTRAPLPSPRSNWYADVYAEVKALNPRFPFLLRPVDDAAASVAAAGVGAGAGVGSGASATPPMLFVEYDFGAKVSIDLAGLSEAQIDAKLRDAVLAGDSMPRAFHQSQAPLRLPTVVD